MARLGETRTHSGSERQFRQNYTRILRALSNKVSGVSETTPAGAARRLTKGDVASVQQAIVSGELNVIGTLESREMVGISDEGRQHLVTAFQREDIAPLARLCNFDPQEGSLSELHAMYRRVLPRLMAFGATKNGHVLDISAYRVEAAKFLDEVVLPALPAQQRDFYRQAVDLETDLQGSTIGVSMISDPYSSTEQRVVINRTPRRTMAIVADNQDRRALDEVIANVIKFDPTNEDLMRTILSALEESEQRAAAEQGPVTVVIPGGMGGSFSDMIREALQGALGGERQGTNMGIIVLEAGKYYAGEQTFFQDVVGGVMGSSFATGFIGRIPTPEEPKSANPFQSEAEIPQEDELGERISFDTPPTVATFSYTAGADSQFIIISDAMKTGIARAMSKPAAELAPGVIAMSMIDPEQFLLSAMQIKGMTAKERIDFLTEVALIGWKQDAPTMAGVILQIGDYQTV